MTEADIQIPKEQITNEEVSDEVKHQIINGLQQASINKSTTFPSRDVPASTEQLTTNPYQQPNYIPPAPESKQNYIIDEPEMQIKKKTKESEEDYLKLFQEHHHLVVMFVLFLFFQLPSVKSWIIQLSPILSNSDSNMNIYGMMFTSFCFTCSFYVFSRFIMSFQKNI